MNQCHSCKQKHHHTIIIVVFVNLHTSSSDHTEVPNFFLPSHQLEASMRAIQLAPSFRDSLSDSVSICQGLSITLVLYALSHYSPIMDTDTHHAFLFELYIHIFHLQIF